MPIIEWKNCYVVGIQEIDQHHQSLVQYLNKTYDHFREGHPLDPSVLEILIDYSMQHFGCEERWMENSSYPKLGPHKEEHRQFRTKISQLKKKQALDTKASVELLWFLCNWVTHHIRETDADFGRYLNSQSQHG
ncbi:bacteriohemerythrin [Geomonas oryzisoli]|uniref:Bacteriohemerythrin n=1 Tax=Geomonas oryzisoli TaxID=2847992 RepID=A0ABX8JBE3_9BACT|nr:bacteriohemerythrin [Geomonas oryzisoli]QWV94904.1 bacteriohemerythrin [Geomonas oryzisoli]